MVDLAGQHVLVAGAGVTGTSVARALRTMDAVVTVTDADPQRLAELDGLDVRRVAGLDAPPPDTALVVTSPGWRPSAPLLRAATQACVEVIGDVELAWRIAQDRERPPTWLAVTGTNGKTTTVGMLEAMLRAAGLDAVACGNVGFAVLDAVLAEHRVLAVELSSFQLHWSNSLAPAASAVLNLAEDHIDWHGSMTAYGADKGTIHDRSGLVVHNADDVWSTRLADEHAPAGAARVGCTLGMPERGQLGVVDELLIDCAFGVPARGGAELAHVGEVRPAGPHNVANALTAAALARAHGVPADAVAEGLGTFHPGAHRAAQVGVVGGVRYLDDSKATNPHAAAGSLLAQDTVVWIAGGQLKGASVDDLVARVADRLRGVVLLGVDSPVIAAAVARHAPDVPVKSASIHDDEPMTAAVHAASELACPGDAVVLAPAAASLDMFRDYAERGNAFAAAVRSLAGQDQSP